MVCWNHLWLQHPAANLNVFFVPPCFKLTFRFSPTSNIHNFVCLCVSASVPSYQIMVLTDPEFESSVLISTDEGASFQKYRLTFYLLSLLFHPTEEDWALAYSHDQKVSLSRLPSWRSHLHFCVRVGPIRPPSAVAKHVLKCLIKPEAPLWGAHWSPCLSQSPDQQRSVSVDSKGFTWVCPFFLGESETKSQQFITGPHRKTITCTRTYRQLIWSSWREPTLTQWEHMQ